MAGLSLPKHEKTVKMSLIDDLKDMMQRASIPETKQNQVVCELSKKYGGSFPYVRKKEGKK